MAVETPAKGSDEVTKLLKQYGCGPVPLAGTDSYGRERKIRVANLAIVGTHSTNGVAAIHSELLRATTVKDLAEMFPERFNNKTNGVTPRRWLLIANPALARGITAAIGDGWNNNLDQLRLLKPLADNKAFQDRVHAAKREAKSQFADWLKTTSGQIVDPSTIFDCQVKRIHEYLNIAGSGKFSSDRTIAQYASEIWGAKPCPVSWTSSESLGKRHEG